ncbi:unnamed protein product [Pleuronectes platessa]|uniref:Uncharacterized protein n=1 Tax=Pleuronectes platessa TaxID=8262 RepID=A0A9N7YV81_PLEPL|nr:unnamed protein product [Pleuronectes platessa]
MYGPNFLSQLLGASRRVPPAVAVAEVIRVPGSPPTARLPRRRWTPPRGTRERKPPHQCGREVPPDEDLPVPHTEPPAATEGLLPQPRHVPSGFTTNMNIGQ